VLFSTDLPLAIDLPIDAGVQQFCESCSKCARECPCNAIPFGPKVMFNGYETWRMDAVKCTSYRIINEKGSFCGRCMKMCPWNTEGLAVHRAIMWLARKLPMTHGWIARMDDKLLNGSRNSVKRWWFDLEIVDGVAVKPAAANERDLDFGRGEKLAKAQKLAFFPPALQPKGGTTLKEVVPIDREAGLEAYAAAKRVV
jgi:ferredoxin